MQLENVVLELDNSSSPNPPPLRFSPSSDAVQPLVHNTTPGMI